MKSVYLHLTERSAPISKTELKVGEVYDDCIYLGDFEGYSYYMAPKNTQTEMTWEKAIEYCKNLKVGKLSDFFLPNKDELFFAYEQSTRYDLGTSSERYWSSSEDSEYDAWGIRFTVGAVLHLTKVFDNDVRAFRKE